MPSGTRASAPSHLCNTHITPWPCRSLHDVSASLERLPNKPRISADEVGELVVQPRIEVSKVFSKPELAKYRVGGGGGGSEREVQLPGRQGGTQCRAGRTGRRRQLSRCATTMPNACTRAALALTHLVHPPILLPSAGPVHPGDGGHSGAELLQP